MRSPTVITAELIASGINQQQTALLMELVLSLSTGTSGRNPVESPEHRALEKRRAWDRERKAREREERRASAVSTGIPVESGGISTGQSGALLVEEENKESLQGKVKKERKKGSRLDGSARASDNDRAFAVSTGIPPDRVDAEWAEFVDYWIGVPGARGVKLDWPATWRNRVRDIAWKYKGHGKPPSGNRTNPAAGRATAREADFLAAMGNGALEQLEKGASGRRGGEIQRNPDTAPSDDSERSTESRDRPAFRVIG